MPIRDCAVIAIDGTHASGKTTLIHALTAHYRRQGINVAMMSEPARSSPFIEEIRETHEEIGLHLQRDAIRMVTSVHYRNPEGHARIGFFFHAPTWDDEPYNAEPHKCARIRWFPLDQLPDNTVPYSRAGVQLYRRGESFGLHGWPHLTEAALAH